MKIKILQKEKFCKKCGDLIVNRGNASTYCQLHGGKGNKIKRGNQKAIENFKKDVPANVAKRLYDSVKARANRNNLDFDLELSDIVIPDVCPVIGIPLPLLYGRGQGYHDDSPSIDRIIQKGGYTKNNIKIISSRANRIKGDNSIEEMEQVLSYMKKGILQLHIT